MENGSKNSVIPIKNIVEGLEMQFDGTATFLKKSTGEIVAVSEEELGVAEAGDDFSQLHEWQQENIKEAKAILETDDYLPLPTKFDIHEYQIMENFCRGVEGPSIRTDLLNSIRGSGAFRQFKDEAQRSGVIQAWYDFRNEALTKIAINWCEANEIKYSTEQTQ